ncbi:MAG: hypothetical protein P1P64_04415 [Treponemataceae bacterium]
MRKFFVLFCLLAGSVFLATSEVVQAGVNPVFPKALFRQYIDSFTDKNSGYEVKALTEIEAAKKDAQTRLQSVLLNNDLVGIYGKPKAYTMGVLGRYKLEDIDPILDEYVQMYDKANGERGVIPVLYIIYGTCFPGGDIGLLSNATVKRYVEYAAERGWYVFLDHQIGRFGVKNAMNALLPFLKYPNVHLAIDPEWHTTRPMKEIGSVTSADINMAQQMMQDYMIKNNIQGSRFFVIHQFNAVMISNRYAVKSNYEKVQLILCSDGHGPPHLKRQTYAYNALAKNIPLKSFKLFTKPTVAGAGYDIPLMTPEQVLELKPRPYFIMYQ